MWWSARNKANDEGRMFKATDMVCNSVCYFLMEFEKLNVLRKNDTVEGQNTWKSPPVDRRQEQEDGVLW